MSADIDGGTENAPDIRADDRAPCLGLRQSETTLTLRLCLANTSAIADFASSASGP